MKIGSKEVKGILLGTRKVNAVYVGTKLTYKPEVNDIPYSQGLEYSYDTTSGTYTVIGIGTCTDTDLIIPSEYSDGVNGNGMVTSIGDSAFNSYYALTSIKIPDTVTSIGSKAFVWCNKLSSIEIPNSVTSIGAEAFKYCKSLTSIEIPSSVTSISEYAFEDCDLLTSVVIGDGLTSIAEGTFTGCQELTSVEIPDTVTSIGRQSFYYCTKLEKVTFKRHVNETGSYKSIKLTSIGEWAFRDCEKLKQIVSAYSIIENNAFGHSRFSYLQRIDSGAFLNCASLVHIDIPENVTTIRDYAFSGCTALSIDCEADSKPSGWESDWNYSNCPVNWGMYIG